MPKFLAVGVMFLSFACGQMVSSSPPPTPTPSVHPLVGDWELDPFETVQFSDAPGRAKGASWFSAHNMSDDRFIISFYENGSLKWDGDQRRWSSPSRDSSGEVTTRWTRKEGFVIKQDKEYSDTKRYHVSGGSLEIRDSNWEYHFNRVY